MTVENTWEYLRELLECKLVALPHNTFFLRKGETPRYAAELNIASGSHRFFTPSSEC